MYNHIYFLLPPNILSILCVIKKPPTILTLAKSTAKRDKQNADIDVSMVKPIDILTIIIMLETALVTDISGACNAGVTDEIT